MMDFLIGFAFVAMVLTPAAVAFIQHTRSNGGSEL